MTPEAREYIRRGEERYYLGRAEALKELLDAGEHIKGQNVSIESFLRCIERLREEDMVHLSIYAEADVPRTAQEPETNE